MYVAFMLSLPLVFLLFGTPSLHLLNLFSCIIGSGDVQTGFRHREPTETEKTTGKHQPVNVND